MGKGRQMEERDKIVTSLLAIFLGAYGAHFFYIGNTRKGVKYLLLSVLTGICAPILAIIALIDGIQIFSMTDAQFAKYLKRNGWDPAAETVAREAKQKQLEKEYSALLDSGAITEEEFEKIRLSIANRV